uniref:Phosphorylase b kinase regulatory subunit n=1 Tax=Saccoglossus kowalevskii TaxID=10224 RepID=A0ABM0GLB1_SACKO|nr:PREDICTED: phosphorylase b kinase regulatory subunit beta-like [Saccoglossus kowalevskii]
MSDDMKDVAQEKYKVVSKKLDGYYKIVKQQILCYQSPITGLFPVDTSAINQEAKVRDSVYCAVALWSLALAYRRIDNDLGRTYELEQSAVKCMRGILFCYMRQADKVEKFKYEQVTHNALHAKYKMDGKLITEHDYEHLQIDATSLYLLYLAQMIQSGLQIIYTMDEVNYIQNVVYYLERAYRTPDYGIWEMGSKYNNGTVEMHASSIGMAKAALEAMSGFNLFGEHGAAWSTIYVDIDAHNRNRTTLETLLPRESSSKNTDAALITTLSFPAFAVSKEDVVKKTLDKLIRKLRGRYGFKRCLRDGYGTVLEDRNRKHYRPAEIKLFDGIESEWPIFFAYMVIDGVARGNKEQVDEYETLLRPLVKYSPEGPLLPKYYYVPKNHVEAEKKNPGSQEKDPSEEIYFNKIFLWGQAIYFISRLLVENLLNFQELDPLGRFKGTGMKKKQAGRYAMFKKPPKDLCIQVALIAESSRLQSMLATYGILSQTPVQCEPYEIWPPNELVRAFENLGVNTKLGLSGRPPRPIGSLGTSKLYRILGRTVVCYPIVFDLTDFYMAQDMSLLIDDIKSHLAFIRDAWTMHARPTFCVIIREDHISGSSPYEMLDLLASFKRGECNGIKVKIGRLQTMIDTSIIEPLEFINLEQERTRLNLQQPLFQRLEEVKVGHSPLKPVRSITSIVPSYLPEDQDYSIQEFENKSAYEILQKLNMHESMVWQSMLLGLVLMKEGAHYLTDGGTVGSRLEKLYRQAGVIKQWAIVRYCASLLNKVVDSLAPGITTMLVRGKLVTVGTFGHEEQVISTPLTPKEIAQMIYSRCSPYDLRECVLQQELIIDLAKLMQSNPDLFDGMLKIRVGWVIHAMKAELTINDPDSGMTIHDLSPTQVRDLLHSVLSSDSSDGDHCDRSWLQKRQMDGALNRNPPGFYDKVWEILERTVEGMVIAGYYLPQQPTISDMTKNELNFAKKVEEMLGRISQPEYRQMMVELLVVVATILYRNPELVFQDCVDMDQLLNDAFDDFQKELHDHEKQDDMTVFFDCPPFAKHGTASYMAKAVTHKLLDSAVQVDQSEACVIS